MKERSRVWLSKHDQQELRRLLQSGLQPVRTVLLTSRIVLPLVFVFLF